MSSKINNGISNNGPQSPTVDDNVHGDDNTPSQLTTSLAAAAAAAEAEKRETEGIRKSKNDDESDETEEEDDDDDFDEDDDDSDDSGDDDDDDDEEVEPQLKYQRLRGSLDQIFNSENGNYASALAVGDKFLVRLCSTSVSLSLSFITYILL